MPTQGSEPEQVPSAGVAVVESQAGHPLGGHLLIQDEPGAVPAVRLFLQHSVICLLS